MESMIGQLPILRIKTQHFGNFQGFQGFQGSNHRAVRGIIITPPLPLGTKVGSTWSVTAAFLLVILFHFITCYPIFCLVIFPSMSIFLGDFLRSSKFPLFPRLHGFWEPLAADAGRTHHLAIEAGDLGRSISMDLATKSWRMDHN